MKKSIKRFAHDLAEIYSNNPYVIFLCGPSLDQDDPNPATKLREKLRFVLESEGFEVVLGEDDGLEALRKMYHGLAHENELEFIKYQANSVILIAASVGSFCELGLFSYYHLRENHRQTDFILILNSEYKRDKSYVNEGPAKAIEHYGRVVHTDFSDFEIDDMLERLNTRRNVWSRDLSKK